MTTGKLHSIETFGAVDGPGIRTVFFLQGCPARCIYCHNPDTWNTTGGRDITVEEIVKTAKRSLPYYGLEGGVTFSGGEPLMQGQFLIEAMEQLSSKGINSILDTSGTYVDQYTQEAIAKSQMLLLDIKHQEPETFMGLCNLNQSSLLQVIRMANEEKKPVLVRQVVIPGINDTEANVISLKSFVNEKIDNIYKIELLGYHNMAIEKWAALKIPYKLERVPNMDKRILAKLASLL
ncbi:MAG: pyruvate formate-lyase-activating protein [Anaerovoracaceae bacterium]